MVAVKGRLNTLRDRTTEDLKMSKPGNFRHTNFNQLQSSEFGFSADSEQYAPHSEVGEVKNFKIYVEVDKVKNPNNLNNRIKRQSATCKSGGYVLNANESKSGVKNLEKGKSKPYESMSSRVGRKVLADIGNRSSSFLKTEQGKSSKPGKGKSEIGLLEKRVAVGLGDKEGSSSGKLSLESIAVDPIQNPDESNQTSKKSIVKANARTISGEPRTKVQSRNSISTIVTGRKSVRHPPLTRKSLPVLKQSSRVESSGTAKKNSERLSNFRGKHGFPVNPSAKGSIAPKPNNLSRRPWGNRVSDGFTALASRAEAKVDAEVRAVKSIKPSAGRTTTSLSARRNSKLNHITIKKKVTSRPADLSQRKEDKVSVFKNIPSVVSQDEPALQKDNNSSATIERRKSDRRNSFISSLMSRSKFLKECNKVTSKETLPDIYDDRNHLEVSDYVDDIYQYYWVMEGQNPLLKNYLEIQKYISPQMRGILINWLIEVHQKFDLMEETLFLTVTLFDRYLALENIEKNEIQLVGLTALLLASKYEDFWHPRVTDLISISAESYTKNQMLKMEKAILQKLKFRLNQPTPYVFMLRFLKAAQSDTKFEGLAFYLIELCLVEYEALNYKPSMLCASAIYVARCTMRLSPPWTPLLAKHTHYEVSQIRDCSEMILKFHKAAKPSLLKVTYEKYAKDDRSRVSIMKPRDRLPS